MSIQPEVNRIPYTPEAIAKLNQVLEAVGGNRNAAGEVLEIPASRVKSMIELVPSLNARWKTTADLMKGEGNQNSTTAITRTPPKELAISEKEKVAVALVVQEKNLKRSLGRLGFKSAEIEALSAVEEFAGMHFKETLSVMHGGMLKGAMRLMMLADRIENDYLQDDNLDPKDKRWWWDVYFRILESLRLMNDQANKAALTKAMIEIKEKESKMGVRSDGKPGFSPLTAAVQVNVTGAQEVNVSRPPNDPAQAP